MQEGLVTKVLTLSRVFNRAAINNERLVTNAGEKHFALRAILVTLRA